MSANSEVNNELPVAVIGAGPAGLAAAAHLIRAGLEPLVLEAGPEVAASVADWGHVRVFSPWRYNVDAAAAELLTASGWTPPDGDALPTGHELREKYLLPLARLEAIRSRLRTGVKVESIGRKHFDKVKNAGREEAPFEIIARNVRGEIEILEAAAVIDASGTWSNPNPLGAGGRLVPGESEHAEKIRYGIPDIKGGERGRYAGKRVMVVGAGHSAFNVLLDLADLADEAPGTVVYWSRRGPLHEDAFGGGEADGLPARGALGRRLRRLAESGALKILDSNRIASVSEHAGRVMVMAWNTRVEAMTKVLVDEIIVAAGSRPDFSFLREIRLNTDPALESVAALAPLIDPNVHGCGTVRPHGERELRQPEKDFYIVGSKSYGRAPTFLMATGYEQIRSIVAALTGDVRAAERVELNLPETGVCGGAPTGAGLAAGAKSCC